jgi:hypothetical protein
LFRVAVITATAIAAVGVGCCISVSTAPVAAACPSGTYKSTRTGDCVERPDNNPVGAVAICADGDYDHSETSSGECSGHGGVAQRCPCGGAGAPAAASSSSDGPDSSDINDYLAALTKDGITFTSADGAVNDGNQICNATKAGESIVSIEQLAGGVTNLNARGAALVVVDSMMDLCPEVDNGIFQRAMDVAFGT